MADARKQSVSGTYWPGEPWSVLKTTSTMPISSGVFGAYSMTSILYKYAHLPTLTLFSHFHLQGQYTLSSVTSRENTTTLSFELTTVNRHKYVSAMQTFFYLLHLFGEIFSSLKNKKNFVKPPKETNNMGEDTFLLIYTIKIL